MTRCCILVAVLLASSVLWLACRNDAADPPGAPPPTAVEREGPRPSGLVPTSTPSLDLEEARRRLGETVWGRVESSDWFDGDKSSEAGVRLLGALSSAGPLVSDARLISILEAYPKGIDQQRLDVANLYAQMTIGQLHNVLDAPWLVDGLDAYERAVIELVSERVVTPTALRMSLEDGFFRDLYDANPDALSARLIDAVGKLNPRIAAYAEQQPWFLDGLDDFDVSLLGMMADMVRVEDALAILSARSYQPLELADRTIALVFLGGSEEERAQAVDLIESAIFEVEAIAGEFQPLGLVLDFTPIDNYQFCHGDGGSQYEVGYIGFTGPGCFTTDVVTHELGHTFLGGRYPDWFSEGAAELISYHVEGVRTGYFSGRGKIDLEGYRFTFDPEYFNQGSLGSDFLVDLYHLAGEEEMSRLLADVAGRRMTGSALLARIREMKVDIVDLEVLIADYFPVAP